MPNLPSSSSNSPDDGPDLDPTSERDVEKAKAKLIMDFNLGQPTPEKVTIEVLKQLIRDKPEKISIAIRKWLRPGNG
jgi:hypothetical protein